MARQGFGEMYMVPPNVWEVVKRNVNENQQRYLANLNSGNIPQNTPPPMNIPQAYLRDLTAINRECGDGNERVPENIPNADAPAITFSPPQLPPTIPDDEIRPPEASIGTQTEDETMDASKVPLPEDNFDDLEEIITPFLPTNEI